MKQVKILIFDDEKNRETDYITDVEMAIRSFAEEELMGPFEISTTFESDELELVGMLNAGVERYDLFVCDVLVDKIDKDGNKITRSDGWKYIKACRAQSSSIAIIAWSNGGAGVKIDDLFKAGADEFQPKSALDEIESYNEFGKKIFDALSQRNPDYFSKDIDLLLDQTDIRVLDLIDKIGIATLKEICFQSIRQVKQVSSSMGEGCEPYPGGAIRLTPIQAGLSGAGVFWIEAEGTTDSRPLLIKYSRDKSQILNELVQRQTNLDHFADLFLQSGTNDLMKHEGLFAIAMPFRKGMLGFLDWLKVDDEYKDEKVRSMLHYLWIESCLGIPLKAAKVSIKPNGQFANQAAISILTPGHKARIIHFLGEIEKVAAGMKDGQGPSIDFEALHEFVLYGTVLGLRDQVFSSSVKLSITHGDFHCENILTTDSGRLYAIDPPSIAKRPWQADLARFSCDLLMRGIDPSIESHYFSEIPKWLDVGNSFITGQEIDPEATSENTAALHCLNWINGNLELIADLPQPEKAREEFLLGLSVELLRSLYRVEWYTMQRRLAAAQLAHDILLHLKKAHS